MIRQSHRLPGALPPRERELRETFLKQVELVLGEDQPVPLLAVRVRARGVVRSVTPWMFRRA
jgi:hypothetical protein